MTPYRVQVAFFVALLLSTLTIAFFLLKPYLAPLFFALVLYIVWKPVHHKLQSLFGGRRSLVATISLLLVIVTILLPFALFGVLLSEDARNMYNDFVVTGSSTSSVGKVTDFLRGKGSDHLANLGVDVAGYVAEGISTVIKNVDVLFSGTVRLVFGFFIMLIGLFYLFRDGDRLREIVFTLSPLPNSYDADIFTKIEFTVGSVVKGSLLIALAQGVLATVGLVIFGVPNPVLWGGIAAVTSVIPNIGTAIVLIPAAIYLYLSGQVFAAIGLLVWGVVVVGLVDNFLRMFIIKTGVPVHPFVIFLSIIGGISLFGAAGIVAGPVVISLVYALFQLYPRIVKEVSDKK